MLPRVNKPPIYLLIRTFFCKVGKNVSLFLHDVNSIPLKIMWLRGVADGHRVHED